MQDSKAAIRYARSLFQLAIERKELEEVSKDMELIDKTIHDNRDLGLMLKSPVIKADKKEMIFKQIFSTKIGKTTEAFIDLVIRKGREMHIEQIARQFVVMNLENNGIEEAKIITAYKIDDAFRKKIIAVVEKNTGSKVVLEEQIDPDVIGGFILRYGDKQIDTSLKRDLELLRREFDKNLYVKDY